MFTLLPNGLTTSGSTTSLKFSVFVSPRLDPHLTPSLLSWTLDQFPDLVNWPKTLQNLAFAVNFSNGGPTGLQATLTSTPSPDLWDVLFPPSTYVKPYVYDDYRNHRYYSYNVRDLYDYIKSLYVNMAVYSPRAFPSLEALGKAGLGKISTYIPNVPPAAMPFASGVGESDVLRRISTIRRMGGTKSNRLNVIDYSSNTYRQATIPDIYGQPVPAKELIDFELVKEFYQSLKPDNVIADSTPANKNHGDLVVFAMDFHREISSLSQYPRLMRLLGLVFDLEVTTNLQSIQDTGTVSLSVKSQTYAAAAAAAVTPQSAYMIERTKGIFVARPNPQPNPPPSDLGSGMLLLGNGSFSVIQLDVDAAVNKLPQVADYLLRIFYGPNVTTDSPQSLSLPSLNSAGISVAKTNRAYALRQFLSSSYDNNHNLFSPSGSAAPNDVVLYAEDLTRGYRVDVIRVDPKTHLAIGNWLSVCKRVGTYKLSGLTTPPALSNLSSYPPSDEGWISMSANKKPQPLDKQMGTANSAVPEPSLSLHESVFRWNGWSLCAPRPPGIKMITQDNAKNTEKVDTYDPDAAHSDSIQGWKDQIHPYQIDPFKIPLIVTFKVEPGTLPTLRFGNVYRLRARAVDLAGDSLDLADPSIEDVTNSHDWLTPEIAYNRFEPVQAPTIVLRRPLNLVPQTTSIYINKNWTPWPSSQVKIDSQVSPSEHLDRLVIRSNYNKAASHYKDDLNTLTGHNASSASHYLDFSDRNIAPPRTTEAIAELHGVLDDAAHKLRADLNLYNDIKDRDNWKFEEYEAAVPGMPSYPAQFFSTSPDDMDVHYLADPISQGAALLFLDTDGKTILNTNGDPYLVPFYDQGAVWPNLRLFTLKLVEGSSFSYGYKPPGNIQIVAHPTGVPPPGGELHVALPKGTWVDVHVSSFLSPADAIPEKMGVLGWFKETNQATELNDKIDLTKKGQFWMITPFRTLRLVHAVQQPINAPSLQLNQPEKESGNTYVKLSGQIGFHGSSTAKLDVLTAWEDPIDNPGPDLYKPAPVQDGQSWTTEPPVHHSQHVFQFSQLVPTSSWTSLTFNDTNAQTNLPLSQKHEFGDTKRRQVRYTAVATTRYLEYLPDEVWKQKNAQGVLEPILNKENGVPDAIVRYAQDNADNKSWTTKLDIPSSARPAKPRVLYAVPIFAWDRSAPLTSTRKGNGLRVYLERPWYSSGFGELLGVVLAPPGTGIDVPENLKLLVTQWGQDPLWAGSQIGNLPSSGDFVGTTTAKNPDGTAISPATVVLAELDETVNVTVVAYDVAFDNQRNLWYADVQLNQPGDVYFPFIRLALVRYQPYSVFPNHISPVVLTDYMQLTPDRELTVTQKDPQTLTVMLKGAFPQGTPTAVQVTLQEQSPSVLDPDLGWSKVVFDQTPQPNPTWLTPYTVQPMGGASEVIGFSGDIKLLKPRGTPGYRLLVTEYEKYNIDSDRPVQKRKTDPVLEPLPIVVSVGDQKMTLPLGLRLVYAEAVSLE
jgi:hypothetical protein